VFALPEPAQKGRGGAQGGFGGFGGNNNAASTTAAAAASSTASAAAAGATVNAADAQTSLTLDPAVIATGFEQNGLNANGSEAGEVASLTSNNNFINFCLTVNKPLTNGQQITTGSCNPAPMGVIAASTNMPNSKFTFPANGDTSIVANTNFTISMAINNLETGNFVNAQSNYYSAPQQVNSGGDIIGHTHFVVQLLESLDQTTPLDPTVFAFFKGVNGAAVNGVVTADVTNGLPAGAYKLSSINTAANHQPALVAIAQHGSLDDTVYFTIGNGGAAANNAAAASTTAAAAAASSPAAKGAAPPAKGKQGGKKGARGRRFARDY